MSDTTNNKKAVFECPALKVVALLAVPSLVFLVIIIYILCKASVDNNGFPVLYFTVMLGSFAMLWLLIRSVNGLLGQCISACERVKLEQCRNDGQKNMLNEQNRSGAILNLSPVFLQRNGTGHYFLCDHEFVKEKEKTYELIPGKKINYHSLPGEKSTSLHLTCKCIAEGTVKDYVNKYPFCETIVDLTGKEKFELSSVIRETKQVGVYKHHSRDGEDASSDRAYFKSVYQQMVTLEEIARNNTIYKETFHKKPLDASLQLSPEWTFAFYAELENDQTLAVSEHRIAFMGKEKSAFLIQITDQDIDPSWMSCSAASGLEKVILLSDAYVPESELLKHSLLINGKTVRFRSFSRNISSHKFEYANLKRDGKGEKGDKSESHHLLKRGSVIYTENSSAIAGILKTQKHWRTIGYNYFTVKQAK